MYTPVSLRIKGFTIVELIVVIAVIGILAGISIVGFGRYQSDTRDARRSASIISIAEALEKYYDINGEYPSCGALSAAGTTVSQTTLKGINQSTLIAPQAISTDTNSIKCTSSGSILTSSGVDFFEYQGDGSTDCNGSGSCLQFTLKYKDESSGTIKTISSRRNTNIATSGVSQITATTTGTSTISVSWSQVPNATSYTMQSATNSSFNTSLTSASGTAVAANMTGLAPNTTYYYRVQAFNGTVSGGWSNTAQSTTYHLVTTLAGSGTGGFAEGTGTAAQFNNPYGVAVDLSGTVYVADTINQRIRKITAAGVVTTLAGSGTQGFADGTGTAAQFHSPVSVAVDSSGTVYVADQANHRIRKITAAGVVTTLAGSGQGFADGTGTAAQFNNPYGVAVDSSGTVYVADQSNNRIRKITAAGVVTTLAGSGTGGYVDGTGTAAQFYYPDGVAVDSSGTVYVADSINNRIRKITAAGVVTTLAGSGTGGYVDGTGTAAQFSSPYGVAVDSSGTVYVADQSYNRIRKITAAGVVMTLAGSGTQGFIDGTASAAQFYYPYGVAVDSSGTVYVGDTLNNRIRKIQ